MGEVSQHAREAAARLFAEMGGSTTGCDMMREGQADLAPAVRMFAQFEADTLERCAEAVESGACGDVICSTLQHQRKIIAQAIRQMEDSDLARHPTEA